MYHETRAQPGYKGDAYEGIKMQLYALRKGNEGRRGGGRLLFVDEADFKLRVRGVYRQQIRRPII